MNLNASILDQAVPIDGPTILVVEDVRVFSTFARQCYHYRDQRELLFFDQNLNKLKESELMLVTDLVGHDLNSPALLKAIYTDLEVELNLKPETKNRIERLANEIRELIGRECLENELDLIYDTITLQELFKVLGIKLETDSQNLLDKSCSIIQVYRYLQRKHLLVFVNSLSYLSEEEQASLLEYIQLQQLSVLFLEPRKILGQKQWILDEDYILFEESVLY